jgi:MFS family permease
MAERGAVSSMVASARAPRRGPLGTLLTANAISLVGNQLTALAIPWFVLQTTGSAARTGIVTVAAVVPTILAAFFGGALVDRLGFRRTSIIADVASGVTTALIPLLYATIGLAFWQLLVLVFLGALLDAPGGTARSSLIPDLARLAHVPLERVSAASQTIQGFAGLLGPPVAGLLIVVVGTSQVLWLDAASFAISAMMIGLAVPAAVPRPRTGTRYLDDVRTGLRFLVRDRLLLAIALTATVTNFVASPLFAVILPVYAETRYGSARDLGLAIAGFGAGSLVSSIVFGIVGSRSSRRALVLGGFAVLGLPMWALVFWPPLPVLIAALVGMGIGGGILNPLVGTVLQERTPEEMRGRVLGTFMALALLAAPVGMLLSGFLIEIVGLRPLLAGMGVLLAALTISLAINPAIRELDTPPPGPTSSPVAPSVA